VRHLTDGVVDHPLVRDLGEDEVEQERVDRFARDLARWLWGAPADDLGALTRVVTVVAGRELGDARLLCTDRPLLAVEAAARAVARLWPLLRREWRPGDGEDDRTEAVDGWLGAMGAGEDDDDPELRQLAEGLVGDGDGDAIDAAAAAGSLLSDAARAAEDGALQSDALVRHLEEFLPGMGWSMASGAFDTVLLDRLDQLATLLSRLDALAEIAESLGRWEDPDEDSGDGGSEEVAGVHLSGEVAHALPAELALLGDPDTEDLFYQRFIEHRLLTLELAGAGIDGVGEGDRRGPVIACIDTSGSMQGAPELAAKALVLAVCRAVLPRGRPVHLLLFSGPDERVELRLRPGRGSLEPLVEFLVGTFGGGTERERSIKRPSRPAYRLGRATASESVVQAVLR